MSGQQAQQEDPSGGGVGQGVGGGGGQGGGADLPGQGPVEGEHPQLHRDRGGQDPRRQGGEGHRLWAEDLPDRGLDQLRPHQQDEHGHHQPGEIFHPSVSEGVFPVGLPAGQPEADQSDHRGGSVGQVVERVGSDGDGGSGDPGQQLA